MPPQDLPTTFGNWLKHRRRALDFTQGQLAACAGCSIVTIRKFEADERRPSKQLAELLARCLHVPADELENFIQFARKSSPFEPEPAPITPVSAGYPSLPTPTPPPFTPFPTSPTSSASSHLPAPLTSLVGREDALATLTRLLPTTRLLTLTGPGGTGKTRLALETAWRLQRTVSHLFPDGIHFIELAGISAPVGLVPELAKELHIKEGVQTVQDALIHWLQPRKTLLILDNFEQIIEASADLLPLLLAAPGLHLLVTSRSVLHLYGEQEYPVPPLPFPQETFPLLESQSYAAIRLFVERARAVKPGFSLTPENAATLAAICARLDGLPLAIELAAAQSKLYAPSALLAQLEYSLDFLVGQTRATTDRQHTLRHAIAWSFNLLAPDLQTLFAQLGVFSGEFDADAVRAVVQPSPEPYLLRSLQTLADCSMLQSLESETPDTSPRFRMLQTLREYALEHLAGNFPAIQARHTRYYLSLAEQASEKFQTPEVTTWLSRMDTAYDNLRAALKWGLSTPDQLPLASALAIALTEYWKIRGYLTEGRSWLDEILARLDDGQTESSLVEVLAALHIAAADLAEVQRDYPNLRHFLETAHPLWLRTENPAGIAKSYLSLGRMYHDLEKFDQAEDAISQGLTLARELGQPSLILTALNSLGNLAHYLGELPKAQAYIEECLSLARQQGNVIRVSTALGNLGSIHQVQGNYMLARQYFEEALSMFRVLGFKERVAGVLGNLGNTGLKTDDLDFAEARYTECLQIRRELGLREQTDQPLHGLGIVANRRGDTYKALTFLSESLTVQHASGKVRGLPSLIETIGNIALEQGLAREAANLYGAMEALGERKVTAARSPYGQATYDQHVEEMRRQLSTDSFTEAWQTGRTMLLEEAIALARKLSTLLESTSPINQPARGTQVKPSSFSARYVQEDLIAIGGMGEIYRGRDSSTGQLVAIKKIKANLLVSDPETVSRFVREGELLRQLNHPNIVKMLAFQRENGHFWLVMEYVPGGTLRQLLDKHPPLSIQQVLSLALELADALARAHHVHILHRDFKPENILLAADGTPRLTDFGLAYHMGSDTRLTQPGLVMGTTAYLSPEACMGEVLDARSDVWSFGVVLFEMLTGQNPFRAENRMATLVNILTRPLPDLSTLCLDTPPAIISLVGQMLIKEPKHRLDSMRQVAVVLEQGLYP